MLNTPTNLEMRYKQLQQSIGYSFEDSKLLNQALTRRAAINSRVQGANHTHNESLEFLGDRVLNLAMVDIIRVVHPAWEEGQLSSELSLLTKNSTLAGIAKKLNLGDYIIMDSNERFNNSGSNSKKILADSLEAIIGAIYLDSSRNLKVIGRFIHRHWYGLRHVLFDTTNDQVIEMIKLGADIRIRNNSDLTIFHTNEFDAEFIKEILEIVKDWSGIDLRGVDKDTFRGYEEATDDIYYRPLHFNNLNFRDANLSGVNLSSRSMQDVDFSNAILAGADFSFAKFKSVRFTGANISGACFKHCQMDFATRRSYLEAVSKNQTTLYKITIHPDEFWQAVNSNNLAVVKEFIENKYLIGASEHQVLSQTAPFTKDSNGLTALHIAAGKGYEEITRLLLINGAVPQAKVNRYEWVDPREIFSDGYLRNMNQERMRIGSMPIIDKTPLDLASGNGYKNIEKMLLIHMGIEVAAAPLQTNSTSTDQQELLRRYGNTAEKQDKAVNTVSASSGWGCNIL